MTATPSSRGPVPRPSVGRHFALFIPVWASFAILAFLLFVAPFPTISTLLIAGAFALHDRQWVPRPDFLFERRTWKIAILAGAGGQILRAVVDGLVVSDLAWQLGSSLVVGAACGLFVMFPLALSVATADALRAELRRSFLRHLR